PFNRPAAGMSGAMLLLAVIGLVVPALFAAAHPAAAPEETVHLSEGVAVVLAVTYGLSLVFSLVTHRRLLGGEPAGPQPGGQTHLASYSSGVAVAVLCVATALVALESELLVHATEAVVARGGLSQLFLGLIALGLAALIVTIIGLDGESHWFEGVQLLAAYALIALAVWFI